MQLSFRLIGCFPPSPRLPVRLMPATGHSFPVHLVGPFDPSIISIQRWFHWSWFGIQFRVSLIHSPSSWIPRIAYMGLSNPLLQHIIRKCGGLRLRNPSLVELINSQPRVRFGNSISHDIPDEIPKIGYTGLLNPICPYSSYSRYKQGSATDLTWNPPRQYSTSSCWTQLLSTHHILGWSEDHIGCGNHK